MQQIVLGNFIFKTLGVINRMFKSNNCEKQVLLTEATRSFSLEICLGKILIGSYMRALREDDSQRFISNQ